MIQKFAIRCYEDDTFTGWLRGICCESRDDGIECGNVLTENSSPAYLGYKAKIFDSCSEAKEWLRFLTFSKTMNQVVYEKNMRFELVLVNMLSDVALEPVVVWESSGDM